MAVAVAPVSAQSAATPGHLTGTRSGQTYRLSQEIGAGGNGVIYTVSRRPELVAKIHKHPLTQHDIDKLDALTRGATPELLSVAAWPIDLLKSPNGRVVGFVMPRILEARPLYELYSPRSRIQHFPSADFRFLLHAAANVARLFGAVHRAGFICGDVNQRGQGRHRPRHARRIPGQRHEAALLHRLRRRLGPLYRRLRDQDPRHPRPSVRP